jgi:hypothetical protein
MIGYLRLGSNRRYIEKQSEMEDWVTLSSTKMPRKELEKGVILLMEKSQSKFLAQNRFESDSLQILE